MPVDAMRSKSPHFFVPRMLPSYETQQGPTCLRFSGSCSIASFLCGFSDGFGCFRFFFLIAFEGATCAVSMAQRGCIAAFPLPRQT